MVAWWWLIVAFVAGFCTWWVGVFLWLLWVSRQEEA
jgi:hypothetical protein